jgi:hypothetical protein
MHSQDSSAACCCAFGFLRCRVTNHPAVDQPNKFMSFPHAAVSLEVAAPLGHGPPGCEKAKFTADHSDKALQSTNPDCMGTAVDTSCPILWWKSGTLYRQVVFGEVDGFLQRSSLLEPDTARFPHQRGSV